MRVLTIGHGRRPVDEIVECLAGAGAQTLVDIRRYPGSRRNPQFNREPLAAALEGAGIAYRHAVELGGLLADEPGAGRFTCLRSPAFASYAARMGTPAWQDSLADVLAERAPCLMCAETSWLRCHRRLVAELLAARGHEIVHLLRPGASEPHFRARYAEARDGNLYLCSELVA